MKYVLLTAFAVALGAAAWYASAAEPKKGPAAHAPTAGSPPAPAPKSAPVTKVENPADWTYLDNGILRLGVKKTSGACIGYLSASRSDRNIVNHYDQGRFIQQSYYGQKDDSMWAKKPWRWNPVQGGEWRGGPSKLLDFRPEAKVLYAKTQPKHWASGADLPEVVMEEWITLEGRVALIRYRMTYTGRTSHPARHQEIPAFFANPEFGTLVLYDGDKPWTGAPLSRYEPGKTNEGHKPTENWAAYVDEKDFGAGAYVPIAKSLTSYRTGGVKKSDCSYFAMITTFAITPGLVFNYDVYLTVGTSSEIRATFKRIHDAAPPRRRRAAAPRSQPLEDG